MSRPFAWLLLASVSWGLSVPVTHLALDHASALDVLLVEVVAGTVLLGGLVAARRSSLRGWWRTGALLGLLEPGLAYVFANTGLERTSSATGSLLLATESVFVVVLAVVFLRSRLSIREGLAVALGFAGAAAVALAEPFGGGSVTGNVLVVLAALAAGVYTVLAGRLAGGADPVGLVFRQGVVALALLVPVSLVSWSVSGSTLPGAGLDGLALATLAGVLGFAAPFVIFVRYVPQVRPAMAAASLNLIPVVGVAASAALGLGVLTAAQAAGGLLLLGALALLSRSTGHGAPADVPVRVELPELSRV